MKVIEFVCLVRQQQRDDETCQLIESCLNAAARYRTRAGPSSRLHPLWHAPGRRHALTPQVRCRLHERATLPTSIHPDRSVLAEEAGTAIRPFNVRRRAVDGDLIKPLL